MTVLSSIVNKTSTGYLFAACLRRTVDREGKSILCRTELMRRAFASPASERRLADRLGLPSDDDLRTEVLQMHGLRAVWMPAIEQYRIELIAPVAAKKHTRRPRAKCPRCEQAIRYTPISATGARILDRHYASDGVLCLASLRDVDEARTEAWNSTRGAA